MPYLIFGTAGWILLWSNSCSKTRRMIGCAVLALLLIICLRHWKDGLITTKRYYENSFIFFVFGTAYWVSSWPLVLKHWHSHKKLIAQLKIWGVIIVLIAFGLKFFRYNPYKNYVQKISNLITQDSRTRPVGNGAIVALDYQYQYDCPFPYEEFPTFLRKDNLVEAYMQRAIRQYEFQYDTLYITTDFAPDSFRLSSDIASQFALLKSFKKNRRGRMIYVYRYQGTPYKPVITQETQTLPALKNMFHNGTFEKVRQQHEPYYKLVNSNIIPDGKFFPTSWDVRWALGYEKGTVASVYCTDQDPIEGKYSFRIKSNQTVSFLYESPFSQGDYLLRCDLRVYRPSTFGLQISLRDQQYVFQGFRQLKTIELLPSETVYHYETRITQKMNEPFENFYLYFVFYGESDVLIDNISLTKMENQ